MPTLTFVVIGAAISSVIGYLYMVYPKSILRNFFTSITEKNPALFKKTEVLKEEIFELIKRGENENIEFKSTFRTNLHTNEIDRKVEYSVLKTIAAFINSKGGTLLVGISDSKEIIGIEKDNFVSSDKLSLHITNLIKTRLGKNSPPLIKYKFIDVDGKTILKIECEKGNKPVFLKTQENEEEFYIRAGPSTAQIKGSELLEYIEKNFKKN
jgi:predicted HTH transcriptional regulator